MNTELLGGGSFKNKSWVDEIQQKLQPEITAIVVYWNGWERGEDAKIDFEAETKKAAELVGNKPFDMVSKSVGSYIGLNVIEETGNLVRKLIICGVPLKDFPIEEIEKRYEILSSISVENVVVFQNEKDPHGSFEEVNSFIAKINSGIKVVKKIGEFSETHNYPYPQDFKEFLLG
ncbi:hypothetical protein ACFL1Q_01315 [Patescibacteria group bacterium]